MSNSKALKRHWAKCRTASLGLRSFVRRCAAGEAPAADGHEAAKWAKRARDWLSAKGLAEAA